MGIVSDDDFNKEIGKIIHPTVISPPMKGRNGVNQLPESLRKVIGESSIVDGNKNVIESFGISQASVSAYKHGATSTSTYNEPNKELKSHINGTKERIIKKASKKLNLALDSITEDKMVDIKARDAAGIAKDMSQIIRNMEPEKNDGPQQQNNIVFYAPRLREESDFETITIQE